MTTYRVQIEVFQEAGVRIESPRTKTRSLNGAPITVRAGGTPRDAVTLSKGIPFISPNCSNFHLVLIASRAFFA